MLQVEQIKQEKREGMGSSESIEGWLNSHDDDEASHETNSLVMVRNAKATLKAENLLKPRIGDVLGNTGGLGFVYRAVTTNGVVVAVKRMKVSASADLFGEEMRRLGRLRHRNLSPPLAYYCTEEERVVVNEYARKGSLCSILHGPDQPALNWPTRLKIIRGIVRGLSYLHTNLSSLSVPHANLKSSNVLLASDYEPLLVDYGFINLVDTSQYSSDLLFAFKCPESPNISPKSDVYCIGILILELLSGKYPSQYSSEETPGTDVIHWATLFSLNTSGCGVSSEKEMCALTLLKVGLACTEVDPEDRLEMEEVATLVEEIANSSEAKVGECLYVDDDADLSTLSRAGSESLSMLLEEEWSDSSEKKNQ